MAMLTMVAPTSNIPTQIGEVRPAVGAIHRGPPAQTLADDPERGAVKTATERAAEAIEAAEKVCADEMGATLGLSPAAKVALIVKIELPSRPLSPKRNRSSHE